MMSRFRCSSSEMRRKKSWSSVRWCVTNGVAAGPPAARREEATCRRDDGKALAEEFVDLGVGHQVEVALAVAHLDVFDAVPLLGRRPQRLRQHGVLPLSDGGLLRAGAEEAPGDGEEVAEVEVGDAGVGVGTDDILLEVALDAFAAI